MTLLSFIQQLTQQLDDARVENPKRVAEELIAHQLDCGPLEIYTSTASADAVRTSDFESKIQRIKQGEPLQYVIGQVDFFGLYIKCDSRALIPRPETEELIEEILKSSFWTPSPATVVDVGTGSGCIIITLATHHPEANLNAIDLSPAALELANENAKAHGLDQTIRWHQGSLLSGFDPVSMTAVVANLPYISSEAWAGLSPSVRDHEPQSALDSGPSGMELIEELATQARTVLKPNGMIFLEYGFDQGDAVAACLNKNGYENIRILKDLSGLDRMAVAQNPA